MKNYQAVDQWAATLNADKAYEEITRLRQKYPWLKCDESFEFIAKLYMDLPRIANIIKSQEKQNAMHREFIRVSQIADQAIILGVAERLGVKI
jgi:hypothetical protein